MTGEFKDPLAPTALQRRPDEIRASIEANRAELAQSIGRLRRAVDDLKPKRPGAGTAVFAALVAGAVVARTRRAGRRPR